MPNTTGVPYTPSGTVPVATFSYAALTAVGTTGSTTSTPYGFTTATQADAIVAQVNKLIANQDAIKTQLVALAELRLT